MKLISKVTESYCIADDFCKEYELELNNNKNFGAYTLIWDTIKSPPSI